MSLDLIVKHKTKEYPLSFDAATATVADLQREIALRTQVAVESQKLLGLGSAKSQTRHDATQRLVDVPGLRPQQKIVLLGVTGDQLMQIRETEAQLALKRQREEAEEAARLATELAERERLEREAAVRAERLARERAARDEAMRVERERAMAEASARREAAAAAVRRGDDDDGDDASASFGGGRRALNESFDADAVVRATLAATTPAAGTPLAEQLETGDKLLLPVSVLDELTAARVAFPFVFRIARVDADAADAASTRATYARVAEFTASPGTVVMSTRLLEAIGVAAGATLRLSTVRPRAAARLRLRPRSARWIDVDDDERSAALAFSLRNYATASVGTPIALDYANQRWLFDVLDVVPRADDGGDGDGDDAATPTPCVVVSLTNVDVECDVIEPLEPIVPLGALVVDGDGVIVELERGKLAYFAVSPTDGTSTTSVSVVAEPLDDASDPDLFASQQTKRPHAGDYDGASQWRGRAELVLTPVAPPPPSPGVPVSSAVTTVVIDAKRYVYVSVYAAGDAPLCRCRVSATTVLPASTTPTTTTATVVDTGHRLGDATTTTTTSSASMAQETPCPKCGKLIATQSLAVHSLQCGRTRSRAVVVVADPVTPQRAAVDRCDVCAESLDLAQAAKHHLVRHLRVACPLGCGTSLAADAVRAHRAEYCPRRLVPCQYCAMRLPLGERGTHQYVCGALTAQCRRCEHTTQRKEMKRHVVERHGIAPIFVSPANDWH